MTARFEYLRMEADDLQAGLDTIGMPPKSFCRIFGSNEKTMSRWLRGEMEIPMWVPVTVAVLIEAPGVIPIARRTIAKFIVEDRKNPGLGRFPYLGKEYHDAN